MELTTIVGIIVVLLGVTNGERDYKLMYFDHFLASSPPSTERLKDFSFNYIRNKIRAKNKLIGIQNMGLEKALSVVRPYSCFVLLDNYFGMEMYDARQDPIVLRQLSVAVKLASGGEADYKDLLFVPTGALDEGKLVNMSESGCTLLKKFYTTCFGALDWHEFASNSRPWTCQIQLTLSLPEYIFDTGNELKYPPLFQYRQIPWEYRSEFEYQAESGISATTFPSNISPLHLFVTETYYWITEKNLNAILRGIYYYSHEIQDIRHDIVLFLITWDTNAKVYEFCLHCIPRRLIQRKNQYSYFDNGLQDKSQKIVKLDIARFNSAVIDVVRQTFYNHMTNCGGTGYPSMLFSQMLASDQEAQFYSEIIKYVLANYTFDIDYERKCENGKVFPIPKIDKIYDRRYGDRRYIDGSYFYAVKYVGHVPQSFGFKFPDVVNTLRFVGCGRSKIEKLAFQELVNVFDQSVWLCLFISSIALVILFKRMKAVKNNKALRWLESIIRVYLEQESTERVRRNISTVRMVVLAFSLSATILSNVWRNDNVYNMVLPRRAVPIETVEQLVSENYSVYARTTKLDLYVAPLDRHLELSDFEQSKHSVTLKDSRVTISSEIGYVDEQMLEQHGVLDPAYSIIRNHSSIHPSMVATFINFLNSTWEKTISDSWEARKELLAQMAIFRVQYFVHENDMLREHLMGCNKSALVLPGYLSTKHFKELKRQDVVNGGIHLGKQVYFPSYQAFRLQGFVPIYVVSRFKIFSESGIQEWFSRIILSFGDRIRDSGKPPPTAANLKGNVQVIFVVLVVGLMVAFFVYLLEFHNSISIVLVKFYKAIQIMLSLRQLVENLRKRVNLIRQSKRNLQNVIFVKAA